MRRPARSQPGSGQQSSSSLVRYESRPRRLTRLSASSCSERNLNTCGPERSAGWYWCCVWSLLRPDSCPRPPARARALRSTNTSKGCRAPAAISPVTISAARTATGREANRCRRPLSSPCNSSAKRARRLPLWRRRRVPRAARTAPADKATEMPRRMATKAYSRLRSVSLIRLRMASASFCRGEIVLATLVIAVAFVLRRQTRKPGADPSRWPASTVHSRKRSGRCGRASAVPLVLAVSCLIPVPGPANASFQTGLATEFQSGVGAQRSAAFERAVDARAEIVRLGVSWRAIAASRPADPTNPFDPAYNFGTLDQAVADASAAGLTPLVTVSGAPRYGPERGSAPARRRAGTWKPDPGAFGQLATRSRALLGALRPGSGPGCPAGGALLPGLERAEPGDYFAPQYRASADRSRRTLSGGC